MAIHNASCGLKLSAVALAACSVLVGYSYWQANRIDELNHSLSQQLATIELLRGTPQQYECQPNSNITGRLMEPLAHPQPELPVAESGGSITPSISSKQSSSSKHSNSKQITTTQSTPTPLTESDTPFAQSEDNDALNPGDVRAYFTELLGEAWVSTYSDAELLEEGPTLLAAHIENRDLDFETSLSAAYALNELSGSPIPEQLSQTLLYKADMSNDPAQFQEVLFLIAEQDYSQSSQLATDLINSSNEDARMVGIYLLATDQDGATAAPALANQIYTYPKETIEVLGQLLGD